MKKGILYKRRVCAGFRVTVVRKSGMDLNMTQGVIESLQSGEISSMARLKEKA